MVSSSLGVFRGSPHGFPLFFEQHTTSNHSHYPFVHKHRYAISSWSVELSLTALLFWYVVDTACRFLPTVIVTVDRFLSLFSLSDTLLTSRTALFPPIINTVDRFLSLFSPFKVSLSIFCLHCPKALPHLLRVTSQSTFTASELFFLNEFRAYIRFFIDTGSQTITKSSESPSYQPTFTFYTVKDSTVIAIIVFCLISTVIPTTVSTVSSSIFQWFWYIAQYKHVIFYGYAYSVNDIQYCPS